MSWNHRVLVTMHKDEPYFAVHEVHYDENGKPVAYTKEPVRISADDIDGIEWQLDRIEQCLMNTKLWAGDRFPEEYREKP